MSLQPFKATPIRICCKASRSLSSLSSSCAWHSAGLCHLLCPWADSQPRNWCIWFRLNNMHFFPCKQIAPRIVAKWPELCWMVLDAIWVSFLPKHTPCISKKQLKSYHQIYVSPLSSLLSSFYVSPLFFSRFNSVLIYFKNSYNLHVLGHFRCPHFPPTVIIQLLISPWMVDNLQLISGPRPEGGLKQTRLRNVGINVRHEVGAMGNASFFKKELLSFVFSILYWDHIFVLSCYVLIFGLSTFFEFAHRFISPGWVLFHEKHRALATQSLLRRKAFSNETQSFVFKFYFPSILFICMTPESYFASLKHRNQIRLATHRNIQPPCWPWRFLRVPLYLLRPGRLATVGFMINDW